MLGFKKAEIIATMIRDELWVTYIQEYSVCVEMDHSVILQ